MRPWRRRTRRHARACVCMCLCVVSVSVCVVRSPFVLVTDRCLLWCDVSMCAHFFKAWPLSLKRPPHAHAHAHHTHRSKSSGSRSSGDSGGSREKEAGSSPTSKCEGMYMSNQQRRESKDEHEDEEAKAIHQCRRSNCFFYAFWVGIPSAHPMAESRAQRIPTYIPLLLKHPRAQQSIASLKHQGLRVETSVVVLYTRRPHFSGKKRFLVPGHVAVAPQRTLFAALQRRKQKRGHNSSAPKTQMVLRPSCRTPNPHGVRGAKTHPAKVLVGGRYC